MSEPARTSELDTCGCCETDPVDGAHHNPPGQSELAYRIGTHSSLFRRMVARLSRSQVGDGSNQKRQPLAALTTRAGDDPAIALLDAWATVGDVLTFYQERIANEGFLRTATERRSVLELARAIGYELGPGVAAETFLAFIVDDAPGAPLEARVPAGTQVQSIPSKQGELPQTFETGEDFVARPEWNELRPQLAKPQNVWPSPTAFSNRAITRRLYLEGTETNLQPGDKLLLVSGTGRIVGTIGEVIAEDGHTLVKYEPFLHGETAPGTNVFTDGSNTPAAPAPESQPSGSGSGAGSAAALSDPATLNFGNVTSLLHGRSLTERQLQGELKAKQWEPAEIRSVADGDKRSTVAGTPAVFALREKVGIFGHNTPYYPSLPENTYPNPWDGTTPWNIWKDPLKDPIGHYEQADIFLERVVRGIAKQSWLVLEQPDESPVVFEIENTVELSLTGFGLSAQVSGLNLYSDKFDKTEEPLSKFGVRQTTAYVKSERLTLAGEPIRAPLSAGDSELTLDGLVLGLQIGQAVAIRGEQDDVPGLERREIRHLRQILHDGGLTTLRFSSGLQYGYRRDSVTINGNVVRATHGETTMGEVLGSGDTSQVHQRFLLKKPPLTHVSAATADGVATTLSVRVNGLAWQEAPSLYNLHGNSQHYIVRRSNEGETVVMFGDGQRGARLPTGQENVVATYRSGVGAEGEVGPESLTLLRTRPFGVGRVTNPTAASGSANPETLDTARTNAPLTVLTLDRIVSLQDYEDFSRAFAGVDKAKAVVMWDGEQQVVHITVAGSGGQPITGNSTLFHNLRQAIDAARDPLQQVRIGSYQSLLFDIKAKVLVNAAYRFAEVQAQVEAALLAAFGFERRAFGQSVTAAEIVEVMHGVSGITAVDLDGLALSTTLDETAPITLAGILPARSARPASGGRAILPAQLLLINETGLTLTEMRS